MTDDGGATWQRRFLPNDEYYITALWRDPGDPAYAFAAVHNGFTVMMSDARRGPSLYETRDGGRTWAVALRGKMEFHAIVGLDSRRIWAGGDRPGTGAMDVIAILEPE
jgi:photosystem II stability/assembly factor-like uncharacterized protein